MINEFIIYNEDQLDTWTRITWTGGGDYEFPYLAYILFPLKF